MTANPMVTPNRAVATAMANRPRAGLALVDGLGVRLGDHHRLHAVRARLLEQAGAVEAAADEFRAAAARPGNLRERHYPASQAARLTTEPRRANWPLTTCRHIGRGAPSTWGSSLTT